MDKLKGSITESDYDRFYQSLRDQAAIIATRLMIFKQLKITTMSPQSCMLKVSQQAYDLFTSSEVEEKRQLIKLILSNLSVDR